MAETTPASQATTDVAASIALESEIFKTNEEHYDFGIGEVVRVSPEVIRTNEATGEPVNPILYVQGMNGNDKLPHIMSYLATRDARQVIAVRYYGKAQGSPKPVQPDTPGYRSDATITELDIRRADDLLGALRVLDDVKGVTIVAESAGAVRALVAADKIAAQPERDPNSGSIVPDVVIEAMLLVDPAGQDGRSYRQAHLDALRLARAEKRTAKLGNVALTPIAELPKMSAIAKQQRDRPEQQAVAHAQLQHVLAEVSQQIPVRVLSDTADVAFRTERIAEQMRKSGASDHAELVQTDKGGHGIGLNQAALDMVITNLHELEAAK